MRRDRAMSQERNGSFPLSLILRWRRVQVDVPSSTRNWVNYVKIALCAPKIPYIFVAEIGLTSSVLYRSSVQPATAMQSAISFSFQASPSLSLPLCFSLSLSLSLSLFLSLSPRNLHSATLLLTDIHVPIYISLAILCRFVSSHPLSLLGFSSAALQKALSLCLSLSSTPIYIYSFELFIEIQLRELS